MKRKALIVLTIAVAVALGAVTIAHAKWGEGGRSDRPYGKQDKERMRERIELMKMWKLTEALDLDQETAAKLFPLMHEFDVRQRQLHKNRGETIKLMREKLDGESADSSALRALITEFKKNERKMVDLRIERLDSMSEHLSDVQVAKMIALVPRFERGVRELLGDAREMRKERRMMRQREHVPPEGRQGPPLFD